MINDILSFSALSVEAIPPTPDSRALHHGFIRVRVPFSKPLAMIPARLPPNAVEVVSEHPPDATLGRALQSYAHHPAVSEKFAAFPKACVTIAKAVTTVSAGDPRIADDRPCRPWDRQRARHPTIRRIP
ncbi:MAG TPA: hypothetical protein VK943_05590, partial [Arenibaculum sp.]|nr:hypothetical protein [Arenibaculum sp.]